MLKNITICILAVSIAAPADAARVKDIAQLAGVRDNSLIGYGLVVGLNGTGDSNQTLFTVQSVSAMLSRMGMRVDPKMLRTRNVAAVIVTAKLAAFAMPGTKTDVVVSSIGDARSLRGGTLVLTPLKAVNGEVYATAQGPLSVGGFSAKKAGSSVTKNHPTVGRVPSGATIEREVGVELKGQKQLVYILKQADFTTASNVAAAITQTGAKAQAVDSRRIVVTVPDNSQDNPVPLIARIEIAKVKTDTVAKVVMNARTGTVVMGTNVRLGMVALAHGGLQVEIAADNEVVQPGTLAKGKTAKLRNATIKAKETKSSIRLVKRTASLGDLVSALNAMGVSPRDLIDILQAVRQAGALEAEIEIQ